MTESEYRTVLGSNIRDAVLLSKASAGRLIERAVLFNRNDRYENENLNKEEQYADLFNEVSKIMSAFALEIAGNLH